MQLHFWFNVHWFSHFLSFLYSVAPKLSPAKLDIVSRQPDPLHQKSKNQTRPVKLPQQQQSRQPIDTIVAIPISETPMIRKNQEFRNGKRRSSFALRGKRASSIGNGFVGKNSKDPLWYICIFCKIFSWILIRVSRTPIILWTASLALPHASIIPQDFYRHISPELPGPVRMKQLLAWCGRRAIDAQPSSASNKKAEELGKASLLDTYL